MNVTYPLACVMCFFWTRDIEENISPMGCLNWIGPSDPEYKINNHPFDDKYVVLKFKFMQSDEFCGQLDLYTGFMTSKNSEGKSVCDKLSIGKVFTNKMAPQQYNVLKKKTGFDELLSAYQQVVPSMTAIKLVMMTIVALMMI